MKRTAVYLDDEGLHVFVFEDRMILEHHLKPSEKITEEDIARVFWASGCVE